MGFLGKEKVRGNLIHGMYDTRPYRIWKNMIERCCNPKHKSAKNYSLRGIGVCDRWKKFTYFWEDMSSGYGDKLQIDRIDNSLGYFKENCRWVTSKQNLSNTRRNVHILYRGEIKNITEWSACLGIHKNTLNARVKGKSTVPFGYTPQERSRWWKRGKKDLDDYNATIVPH